MTDQPVLVHGVLRRRAPVDNTDARLEELDRLGFTIVDAGLADAEISKLRASLDDVYAKQCEETGKDLAIAVGDADIARAPLAYDHAFVSVATNPMLMEICRRLFGENFVLLMQNGILNRPASPQYQTRWHRDLGYQHFTISSKIAINALLCLDPFTKDTGATHVLAGSHLFPEFPSDQFVRANEQVVSASTGALIIMDALLYHRAGANRSVGLRRAVNHVIGVPLLAQQIDLPRLLGQRYGSDEFLSRYFGYRWNPAPNPVAWRTARGATQR